MSIPPVDTDLSTIQNVLFVDSSVQSLGQYSNASTFVITYDKTSLTTDVLHSFRSRFSSPNSLLTRVGFAFHYGGDSTIFMNDAVLFSDSDLDNNSPLSENVQFILDLIREFSLTHIDFLACNTLQSEKWKLYYQLLIAQTGGNVMIGASNNNTGNILYGGDWAMESTMENIRDIYFTSEVEYYTYLLGFTVNNFTYNELGENNVCAQNYLNNSTSLTSLVIPSSVTYNGTTYTVTQLGSGNATNFVTTTSFTGNPNIYSNNSQTGGNVLLNLTIPSTITTLSRFTFRGDTFREFDLTGTTIQELPEQFAHGTNGYKLKLPITCTKLGQACFSLLQSSGSVYQSNPTPLQLTLPTITTIDAGIFPFYHSSYTNGIRLGSLVMYDALYNYYTYVGTNPTDLLYGASQANTLNNIILNFGSNKTTTTLWQKIEDLTYPVPYYHTFYTVETTDLSILKRRIYNNSGLLLSSIDISYGNMNVMDVLSIMDGGGTNPYTLGIVDSSLNKISADIAYCNVYTKSLSETQKNKLMTYVNTTFKEPHTATPVTNTYVVTVSGGAFWLAANNGAIAAVASPTYNLFHGNSYVFDQSHISNLNYPLTINTNVGRTSRYLTGVLTSGTPGSFNAYTKIDLRSSVGEDTLYYGISGGTVPLGGTFTTTSSSGPSPFIQYTFESIGTITDGSTLSNSGSGGSGGNAIIYQPATTTLSYSNTQKASGSYSMRNNAVTTGTTTGYIKVNNITFGSVGFTFSTWLYIDSVGTSHHIYFRFCAYSGGVEQLDIAYSGSTGDSFLTMYLQNGMVGSNALVFASGTCFRNRWLHIAVSFTAGKTVTQYLNGRKINTWITSTTIPTNTTHFTLFRPDSATAYTQLNGYIDDYRIYNRVLSDTVINEIYLQTNPIGTLVMPQLPNLIAYYKLSDTVGSTSVSNEVAATGTGTVGGAGVVLGNPGVIGTCAVFNLSTTSHITLPSAVINDTNTGTIMMWVMPTSTTTSFTPGILFSKQGAYGMLTMGVNYTLTSLTTETTTTTTSPSAAKLYFMVNTSQKISGTSAMAASTTSLVLNNWQHIAVTFTSTNVSFYINGATAGSITITLDAAAKIIPATTNQTSIGRNTLIGNGTRSLSARMNGFASWNTVLTLTEIQSIYNVI
jgi:hypothetical protein